MRANPGGEIDPGEVIGRDRLILRLWETLKGQSVVLVSERRMGKSCVAKKMRAEAPEGWIPIYRDLEGIRTPLGFAERFYHDVFQHLSKLKRVASRTSSLMKQLTGAEIGGIVRFPDTLDPHWKSLLESTAEDLVRNLNSTVVLLWDELPLMLHDIARSCGEATAMEVLDALRALRQMHGNRLAMVFTGSIGLHHVVADLQNAGYVNDATNDMRTIQVPPLAPDDAAYLAKELLRGEDLRCQDPDATARITARATDCIPFYIHCVVSAMKDQGRTASPEQAEQIVGAALVDDQDPWHLHHYLTRLERYYGRDPLPVVLALLDELAAEEGYLTLDVLHSRLMTKTYPERCVAATEVLSGNREVLLQLVTLLRSDHYLKQRQSDGAYGFRFQLIKRWWRTRRGLAC